MVGCYGVVSTVKRRSSTVIFQRSLALVLKVFSPSVRLLKVAGFIGSPLLLVPPHRLLLAPSAQLAIYGTRYFYFQRTVVCWRASLELFRPLCMCPVKCVKSPVQLHSSVLLSSRLTAAVRPSVPPFDPASPTTRR